MTQLGITHTTCLVLLVSPLVVASKAIAEEKEHIDSAAVARIIDEEMNRSQAMQILLWLTDVNGPRLTGSPGFASATEWTERTMSRWGLDNVHAEGWGPFGNGWTLDKYYALVDAPQPFPLISYPKAWSPALHGTVTSPLVYFHAETDSALAAYRGRLKDKFVLLDGPAEVRAHFAPEGARYGDSTLLALSNAEPSSSPFRRLGPENKQREVMAYRRMMMCEEEGAAAVLTASRGDGGNVFVQGAIVPAPPELPPVQRYRADDPSAPGILPQIVVAAEQYNRLIRMGEAGVDVKLEVALDVSFSKPDSGHNVIAEIPGTDLKDEVVMIGAHLDSWHGGTGATDDGTGVAACMEAMRILKTLGLHPRRTIRIALWGGEEQGLLGSKGYVKQHFGELRTASERSPAKIDLKPEAEKFSVYFNDDNGTGKFRGVYMQGNESVRPIFRAWLAPFKSMGASTLSPASTGGTDHLSFNTVGLPGFQFIQDPIEYGTRTHHSTMDVYDRVQEDDLKQAAAIMATFAFDAAMRDEKIPRRAH